MARMIVRRNEPPPGVDHSEVAAAEPIEYAELEIRSRRVDAKHAEVWVASSPTGRTSEPCRVAADRERWDALQVPVDLQWSAAAQLGRALASIALPAPVYRVLQEALHALGGGRGLRVRLALDETLIDLPWEYAYRPEMGSGDGIAGFLFLDARVSLVRGAVGRRARIAPSADAQELVYVGTFWPGGDDLWEVRGEYERLSMATRPIGTFLSMRFVDAVDYGAVAREISDRASILHYSGHCDIVRGRGCLVREAEATTDDLRWYTEDLAPLVKRARTRMLVLSACNSGRWPVVAPLLAAGVPAIVGVRGMVTSVSAIRFCETLYAALAVGLSLDEAVTFARQRVMLTAPKGCPCEWGAFMVYSPTRDAVLFPRPSSRAVATRQREMREDRHKAAARIDKLVDSLTDDRVFGQMLSKIPERAVLVLGRFTPERKRVLNALRDELREGERGYRPVVFDFDDPDARDKVETIRSFAGLSRFIVADLSDAKSLPAELQAIVPGLPSVPVLPIIQQDQEPYALFEHIQRFDWVLPVVRYRDREHLLGLLDREVVDAAERKLARIRTRLLARRRERRDALNPAPRKPRAADRGAPARAVRRARAARGRGG